MLSSETDRLTRAVVCRPRQAYFQVEDLQAHNILEVPDRDTSLRQHRRLRQTLQAFGAEVIDAAELEGHPNAVFTRDAALCTPCGYVRLRPGIATRRAEGYWMAALLDELGEPRAGQILPPGTVDGGDVVLCGRTVFVGLTRRTNAAGLQQLAELLTPMGYEMRTVVLPADILHLDKVLMPVAPERLLVCTDIVSAKVLQGFDVIGIAWVDGATANVICLGAGEVVAAESNSKAIRRLDRAGINVHALNLSEFAKGAGGPNCLIMPVARQSDSGP
jgi:dimethylargininase